MTLLVTCCSAWSKGRIGLPVQGDSCHSIYDRRVALTFVFDLACNSQIRFFFRVWTSYVRFDSIYRCIGATAEPVVVVV